jgi:hypothetical protein
MAKNSVIYKEVLFKDSLEKYPSIEGTSICQLLHFISLRDFKARRKHFLYQQKFSIKVKCFLHDKNSLL